MIPATTKIVHDDPDQASAELVFDLMKGLMLDKDPVFAKYLGGDPQSPSVPQQPPPAFPQQQQQLALPRRSPPSSSESQASPIPFEQLSPYSRAEALAKGQRQNALSSPVVSQPPASSQLRKMQEQAAARQLEQQAKLAREQEEREREQRAAAERQSEVARMLRDAEMRDAIAAMEMELVLEDENAGVPPQPIPLTRNVPPPAAPPPSRGASEAPPKRSRFLQD